MTYEYDPSQRPIVNLWQQRGDALAQLAAGNPDPFGTYLHDLTLELNAEMHLVTGPDGGVVESAWLVHDSTANLAAMYLVDMKTALEQGVIPVWLDLPAVNFMRMEGYEGFQILWDGYLELKKTANQQGIRGIDTW